MKKLKNTLKKHWTLRTTTAAEGLTPVPLRYTSLVWFYSIHRTLRCSGNTNHKFAKVNKFLGKEFLQNVAKQQPIGSVIAITDVIYIDVWLFFNRQTNTDRTNISLVIPPYNNNVTNNNACFQNPDKKNQTHTGILYHFPEPRAKSTVHPQVQKETNTVPGSN